LDAGFFSDFSEARKDGSVRKHFQDDSAELQIPPLRCAPRQAGTGGMTLLLRPDS
jgi:hypothetical protein